VVLNYKDNNWSRLREAISYIYKHHVNDFDWILKANDNTFIVMENLRWLLFQYDSDWPLLIGQRFLKEDYMVGTYAISKRAFTRLIQKGFTNNEICETNGGDGDKEISKCLQHLNVLQIDALDDEGKGMFFQNNLESALFPEKIDANYDQWWWHKLKQGSPNCCSDRLIAMQNIWNTHLYYMEYFIYKVHAFGRHRLPEPLPRKKTLEEIVREKF
jgi:glycoprotein-N-acetylgalactosamine 3-beta-galactosyltransferase